MAIREENLPTITTSDFTASDYVRVLDGDSSRKITLQDFVEAIDPLLVAEGFIKVVPDNITLVTTAVNYNLVLADDVVLVDTSGGNITINLLPAATAGTYTTTKKFTFKKKTSDVNKVILTPTGGATIDGSSYLDITGPSLGSVTLFSNGFDWFTI